MKINFSPDDLRPLVEQIVAEVRAQDEVDRAKLAGKLSHPEPEAAGLLGIAPHALRDLRLKGEIVGSRLGRRVVYGRDELLRLLERNRTS